MDCTNRELKAAQKNSLPLIQMITDLLSNVYKYPMKDILYSTKIRASAESVHNHRVLVRLTAISLV